MGLQMSDHERLAKIVLDRLLVTPEAMPNGRRWCITRSEQIADALIAAGVTMPAVNRKCLRVYQPLRRCLLPVGHAEDCSQREIAAND
jgi:hypothetical protein